MKWYYYVIIILIVLLVLFRKKLMTLTGLFDEGVVIRGKDAGGNGAFGSSRIGHIHQGIDIIAKPKQDVKAPFDMEFVRQTYPYKDDKRYLGGVYKINSPEFKGEMKIFYMQPLNKSKSIKKGDKIGEVQDIVAKYKTKGMNNHVHLELRDNEGKLLNPTEYV